MKPLIIMTALAVTGSLSFAIGDHGTLDAPRSLAMLTTTGCDEDVRQWFNPMPHQFTMCGGGSGQIVPSAPLKQVDVNADGVQDFINSTLSFEAKGQYGPRDPGDIMFQTEVIVDSTGTIMRNIPVFRPGLTVGAGLLELFPNGCGDTVNLLGWRDMDLDGDLDLVAWIPQSGPQGAINIYFENVGYEVAPHIAADLNRDGLVNGADLAVVLRSWTTN